MRAHSSFFFRVRLLSLGCILVGLILVGKLYVVQIMQGDTYHDRAERQYASPNQDLWDRGSIFFTTRGGERVSAATLKTGLTLSLIPKDIVNAEQVFSTLSKYTALEKTSFLAKAEKREDPYEEIGKRLPVDLGDKIQAEKLKGVSLFKERWRFYPGEKLASHVLGFVGFDNNLLTGRSGLERYYDDVLARNASDLRKNFFAEIFSDVKQVLQPDRTEGDIVTSIEPTAQGFLENTLAELQSTFTAKQVGGIIMDPESGRIYAMALAPTFDPNEYAKESDPSRFQNSLVENVYEVGSIIKPVTMASGIDAGVVTASSTYYDAGFLTLNGKTISNFDGKGRGQVDMQEVLSQSLNTGAATVALRLGKDRFREYFKKFGLGEETGIDLPAEAAGLVGNLESGRDIELATASYGQGIALTPIQTIRALAALGNGGYLVTPHVVTDIKYKMGLTRSVESDDRRQVIDGKTSEEITRMLVRVVDTALLEGKYKMPQHSIAAKTGTGLIADPKGGGYYPDRFLHSFFGYFPAYNPQFIVFLYAVEPQGVAYASGSLTMPFMKIAKFLINYYEIPPDR